MNEDENEPASENGATVQIYARLRKLMPWEPTKISVKVLDSCQIQNKTEKTTHEYTFNTVFDMEKSNEDLFKTMCKPMVKKVLEGFNAVLIAYGQTGSGKTHTLVGKPDQQVKGVLPMCLEAFLQTESVKSIEVSGVEAYGTHVSRIELFDLFVEANNTQDWNNKQGASQLEPKQSEKKIVKTLQDCWDSINEAHDSSHFAPTGKNPESSRGHVAFIAKVNQESNNEVLESYFVVVDLAGSEGESAFTPDFVKKVDAATLMCRRLEAGCINTGLSQLQVVFNELKVKGKLSKVQGTGLRRILHSYINQQCCISVLFTLSPAISNAMTTASTLKFAVQAGMVKVKPVKGEKKVNVKQLIQQLQSHINEQNTLIDQLNDRVESLEDELSDVKNENKKLLKENENLIKNNGVNQQNNNTNNTNNTNNANNNNDDNNNNEKKGHKSHQTKSSRQQSVMSQQLIINLHTLEHEEDSDGDELTPEQKKKISRSY